MQVEDNSFYYDNHRSGDKMTIVEDRNENFKLNKISELPRLDSDTEFSIRVQGKIQHLKYFMCIFIFILPWLKKFKNKFKLSYKICQ